MKGPLRRLMRWICRAMTSFPTPVSPRMSTGASVTLTDLRQWAEKSLAHYALPRQLVVMTELPRSQLGKVMRKRVREQIVGARGATSEAVAGAREAVSEAVAGARESVSEKVAGVRVAASEASSEATAAVRKLATHTSGRFTKENK